MSEDLIQKYQSKENHQEFNSLQVIPDSINFNRIEEIRFFEPPEEANLPNQSFYSFPSINGFKDNNLYSLLDSLDENNYFFVENRSTGEDTISILQPTKKKDEINIFDSDNRIAEALNSINNKGDNKNEGDEEQHGINTVIDYDPEPVLMPLFQVKPQKSLGRKRKDDLTSDKKHTNKSYDNASKKFMTQGMISVCDFFNSKIYPHGKLKKPNIIQFLPSKVDQIKIYLEQNIRIFFENYSEPKHSLNKDSYRVHNKNLLQQLDELDIDDINLMLDASFVDYFLSFLYDDKIVNGNIFLNKHFKTFKECFNDYYNEEEKNNIKEYCIRLINGEIKPRNATKNKN